MMAKSKNSIFVLVVVAVVAVAAGLITQQSRDASKPLPELTKAVILPETKDLSYVDFIDHNGNPFKHEDLKGYWNIFFFGFTNCPDICPTTMLTLQQVKKAVSAQNKWGNYRVIMVSVDPERDTQERLSNYVPYYDKEFIGLRGELNTTTEFAKQMGILFFKSDDADEFYQIDHSASIILVNPDGEMAGVITAPHKTDEISHDLIRLADYFSDDHQNQPMAVVADTSVAAHNHNLNTHPIIEGNNDQLAKLEITDSWIRPAPPNAQSMAGYLTIKNTSGVDIEIVSVQSPNFQMAMIHDTILENDIAKMQHLDTLVIPAKGEVILAPLAKHLMLMQPHTPLAIGDSATITLVASDGSSVTQEIKVIAQPE